MPSASITKYAIGSNNAQKLLVYFLFDSWRLKTLSSSFSLLSTTPIPIMPSVIKTTPMIVNASKTIGSAPISGKIKKQIRFAHLLFYNKYHNFSLFFLTSLIIPPPMHLSPT